MGSLLVSVGGLFKGVPGEGHLYFKVDIMRVKRLSKSTLNTYFSKCENIP